MAKTKLITGVLLVLAVLFAQVGSAAAAPLTQDGTVTITGTVTAIGTPQTDANGVTTVPVTIQDANGVETTILVSEADAANLTVGQTDATVTGTASNELPEEDVHPIAQVLADYFDVDPGVVEGYHEDGFGFGVIAQAMWMSQSIGGDASLAGDILQAKLSGDYSAFTDPNGEPITNWGQFKKLMRDKDNKHNLGVIVSHHAPTGDQNTEEKGNGKHKPPKKDKPHGNPHKP
jgi:hypothetical protein